MTKTIFFTGTAGFIGYPSCMPNIKVCHPSRKNFIEARNKIFRIGIGRGRKIAYKKNQLF